MSAHWTDYTDKEKKEHANLIANDFLSGLAKYKKKQEESSMALHGITHISTNQDY